MNQPANDKKAETANSTSLATTLVEDNASASQTGVNSEGKEAQSSTHIVPGSKENKETKQKFWTPTKRKMGGLLKS